jgi:SAM-dependent methyltransferase
MKRAGVDTLRGYYATRAITALLNVGFLEEVARQGRVNLPAFAEAQSLDLRILRLLCDYLYGLKILNRAGEEYTFDAEGELIYESLAGAYHVVYAYEDMIHNLEPLLRREKTYGVDVRRRPEAMVRGSGSIGRLLAFPMMSDAVRRHRFQRVLDLGCGDASFLIYLCQHNPDLHGCGLDIEHEAIALSRQRLEEHNLQSRVELVEGDIFEIGALAPRLPAIDVATSVYVLHEFQDRIVEVLTRFRATFPGLPLLMCEVIRHTPEELRQRPGNILEIQLFHELSNQHLFTLAEWRRMFEEAGFANIDETYLQVARTCIYRVS